MADCRNAPDDVLEHWNEAEPAGRAAVIRKHGEPVVVACLTTPNPLRANQLPPDGD